MITKISVLSALLAIAAASVITVQVAPDGPVFTPATVTAKKGDVVSFIFKTPNTNHTVTQSTLDSPCSPLDGGFNSGFIAPNPGETLAWNLTISSDSEPIWYYCEQIQPRSHCVAGMVGAINPPSSDSFQSFLSEARAVTGTATIDLPPETSVVLSGSGASAPSSPVIVASSSVSLPTTLSGAPTTASTVSTTSTKTASETTKSGSTSLTSQTPTSPGSSSSTGSASGSSSAVSTLSSGVSPSPSPSPTSGAINTLVVSSQLGIIALFSGVLTCFL